MTRLSRWAMVGVVMVGVAMGLFEPLTGRVQALVPHQDGHGAAWVDLVPSQGLAGWGKRVGAWMNVPNVKLDAANPKILTADDAAAAPVPGAHAHVRAILNGKDGRTDNLATEVQHADIEAHIEFMVSKGSNSGVYFMGRYEIQILDSFGKTNLEHGDCGGIYQRWDDKRGKGMEGFEGRAPALNASLPAGQWQSFDVLFRAPRFDGAGRKIEDARFIKVLHNGKVVHENQPVGGPTRAAMFGDEKPHGPLMLQGDHGPVAFRNLRIRHLTDAAHATLTGGPGANPAARPDGQLVSVKPEIAPPAAFGKPEVELVLETPHGKMKYNLELLTVKPGQKVKLTLRNRDEMQHNLVICKPGAESAMTVATQALTLGAAAMERHFVPESPLVVVATRIVGPGQFDAIHFTAPAQEGDYPYVCTLPGHAFTMKGVLRVTASQAGLSGVTYRVYEGKWTKLPDFNVLTPVKSGAAPGNLIDMNLADRDEAFGIVFDGTLHAPADGQYSFFLNSDDGSRVLIDGKQVVEYDGIHGAAGHRTGRVQLTKGAHSIRVEFFEAAGGEELDLLWSGPAFNRLALSPPGKPAGAKSDPKFALMVTDKPRVIRSFLENGAARSICVGLVGGTSYAFDAERCYVQFGWQGGFLDAGPDRGAGGSRGGQPNRILGQRFDLGAVGMPLRFVDSPEKPVVRFEGYEIPATGDPVMEFTVDGRKVRQTISAATEGTGLTYRFQIPNYPRNVTFTAVAAGLSLSSSAGEWKDGVLTVPGSQAKDFTVTIKRKP